MVCLWSLDEEFGLLAAAAALGVGWLMLLFRQIMLFLPVLDEHQTFLYPMESVLLKRILETLIRLNGLCHRALITSVVSIF